VNKNGVTLLEIVIYVSLFAIVTIFIGSQVNSLVKNFSSGTKTSVLQGTGRDALAVMTREIRNTGFKSYLASGTLTTDPKAYYADQSSFIAEEGKPGDKLTTLQVQIKQNGTFSDTATTKYFLNGTDLCKTTNNKTTILSNNVYGLQFQYGILGANDILVQQDPFSNNNWSLTGCTWGASVGIVNANINTKASVECQTTFNTAGPCRISIQFKVEPSSTSPADTLFWVIKTGYSGTIAGTMRFKPSTSDNEVIIPVNTISSGKVSLSFTKVREGSLKISYVRVRAIDKGAYTWTNLPATAQKQYVKAIRIFLLSRSAQKGNTIENTPIIIGNDTIPRSGPYTWRLNTEVVEIPNNGLF
jgi:hypothetical protein